MRLKRLLQFCGNKCSVYTVEIEKDLTRFDNFILENRNENFEELSNIAGRLKSIGNDNGALEDFFKLNEGKPGDDICALFDRPKVYLRLYCIRLSSKILIIGGGGPKTTRTWQEDTKLAKEVDFLMTVSATIKKKMKLGDLTVSSNGLKFLGNLNIP